MTTAYLIKRCNSLSFAKSFKHIPTKFSKEELKNVIFISDSPKSNVDYLQHPISIDDIPKPKQSKEFIDSLINSLTPQTNDEQNSSNPDNSADSTKSTKTNDKTEQTKQTKTTKNNKKQSIPTFIVELARKSKKTIKIPISYDTDKYVIEELDYTQFIEESFPEYTEDELYLAENKVNEYKEAMINFANNFDYLNDKSLLPKFIEFILYVYPHLESSVFKLQILRILNSNNIKTFELERKYPVEYEEQVINTVEPISLFDDIKIIVDKNDPNVSSNSTIYRPDKEELKKASLGNSTQLEAFSKNKFTIIHNKKSANIDDRVYRRNHDVLNSLARNGVVCSPDTGAELSLKKLMNKLSKYEKFNICFVHPSYELKISRSEYPSELIEPSYTINEGELLAIVYRYIIINFFGYCSVFGEGLEEIEYLI